jgi:hypothetical protein
MPDVLRDCDLPQEELWCEGCGWSLPFCTCPDKTKFEEEE